MLAGVVMNCRLDNVNRAAKFICQVHCLARALPARVAADVSRRIPAASGMAPTDVGGYAPVTSRMTHGVFRLVTLLVMGFGWAAWDQVSAAPATNAPLKIAAAGFVGSQSCRECHEKFYQLWSTSFHGLAMQPYTLELARTNLTEQKKEIVAGKYRFLADIRKSVVLERTAEGEKSYPIVQVMGGKNVFYFLTPLERGWLQVLPVAYDVRRREWFDTTASAMRHFGDRRDEALYWKERPLTFNTACFGCHVSQLAKNYDLKSDSYHTTWAEPGIN